MRNKTSIVTSAADGCGKPSSIRSMDNLPSRDHKGAEYKESFMFSNRSPVSHGSSLAAKAVVGTVLAIAAGTGLFTAATARATIIYQDNFNRTGDLVGSTPSPTNTSSASWTGVFQGGVTAETNGSELVLASPQFSASGSVYLPFTVPASGTISLSAAIENTQGGGWGGIGFAEYNSVSYGIGSTGISMDILLVNGYAALVTGTTGSNNNTFNYGIPNYSASTAYQFEIDYNLGTQTVNYYIGSGSSQTLMQTFTFGTATGNTPPTINYVGAGVYSGTGNEIANIQNFTASSVPEPATLGLMAIGGLGLLLIGRKRSIGRSI